MISIYRVVIGLCRQKILAPMSVCSLQYKDIDRSVLVEVSDQVKYKYRIRITEDEIERIYQLLKENRK